MHRSAPHFVPLTRIPLRPTGVDGMGPATARRPMKSRFVSSCPWCPSCRRGALHLAPWRSQRDPADFDHGLLGLPPRAQWSTLPASQSSSDHPATEFVHRYGFCHKSTLGFPAEMQPVDGNSRVAHRRVPLFEFLTNIPRLSTTCIGPMLKIDLYFDVL
jgi:hypothetical protein